MGGMLATRALHRVFMFLHIDCNLFDSVVCCCCHSDALSIGSRSYWRTCLHDACARVLAIDRHQLTHRPATDQLTASFLSSVCQARRALDAPWSSLPLADSVSSSELARFEVTRSNRQRLRQRLVVVVRCIKINLAGQSNGVSPPVSTSTARQHGTQSERQLAI